jgi:hypothetical protein
MKRFVALWFYVFAILYSGIASSDDPCQAIHDNGIKFVSEMPRLSSSQLSSGRFNVKNNKGGLSVSYLVNGKEIFKREWHESCGSGEMDKLGCSAQITPILGVDGYGGLHIAQQARHIGLTCDHLIFPSPSTNSFKSASQPWFITVKDLDNDNVSEIITHEYQQWALDCDLCLACIDATAWSNIYHLSPEGRLIPVNEQFPQRYAELLMQYRKQYDRFKQNTKNYANACSSQQLNNQFQTLINRAEKTENVIEKQTPVPYPQPPSAKKEVTIVDNNKEKQVAPKTISKAKKNTRAVCNKDSNVPSLGAGGAQEALKKFGSSKEFQCFQ